MQAQLSALEEQAYQLAGHPFSLTSVDDISQVLFIELHLPSTGDPQAPNTVKTLGARRGNVRPKQPTFSTSKEILEKLKKLHPLPGLLLEWRRISSALTKVVFPLQREKIYMQHLNMFRIHSVVETYTATGRVTMREPNLQNIPKDFDIQLPGVIGESPTNDKCGSVGHERRGRAYSRQVAHCITHAIQPAFSVSMRNSFVPFTGQFFIICLYLCQNLINFMTFISLISNNSFICG